MCASSGDVSQLITEPEHGDWSPASPVPPCQAPATHRRSGGPDLECCISQW